MITLWWNTKRGTVISVLNALMHWALLIWGTSQGEYVAIHGSVGWFCPPYHKACRGCHGVMKKRVTTSCRSPYCCWGNNNFPNGRKEYKQNYQFTAKNIGLWPPVPTHRPWFDLNLILTLGKTLPSDREKNVLNWEVRLSKYRCNICLHIIRALTSRPEVTA